MTTKAICIEAEPTDIWATLASFESIPEWAPNVDHAALITDQTEGPGMSRRIQQASRVVIEIVTVWEPPHCLEYRIIGLPSRIGTVTNRWEISTHDGHSTVMLTSAAGSDAKGPAKLAGKGLAVALGRVNATMLNGLKAHLENEGLDRNGEPS